MRMKHDGFCRTTACERSPGARFRLDRPNAAAELPVRSALIYVEKILPSLQAPRTCSASCTTSTTIPTQDLNTLLRPRSH